MLLCLNHLCGPSLESFQYLRDSFVLETQVWSQHSCWVSPMLREGKGWPPSDCWQHFPNAKQDAASFKDTLLAHVQLDSTRVPRSFSTKLLSRWSDPTCTRARTWDFSLLNFMRLLLVHFSTLQDPSKWQHVMLIWCISHSSQFSIVWKHKAHCVPWSRS